MGRFDALFEATIGIFCGLCSNGKACENCLGKTLDANGIEDTEKNRARIRDLSKTKSGYEHPWGFSDMAKELGKIRAEIDADKVKAFICQFRCGKSPAMQSGTVVQHEITCFKNPARKACQTCSNDKTYTEPHCQETGEGGRIFECAADGNITERQFDCPKWEKKDGR